MTHAFPRPHKEGKNGAWHADDQPDDGYDGQAFDGRVVRVDVRPVMSEVFENIGAVGA